jgi:hypothetical protein
VIKRSGVLGALPGDTLFGDSPTVIDAGEDAPIGTRGRWIFRLVLAGVVLAGVSLLLISR